MEYILEMKDIHKSFGPVKVLEGIDFSLEQVPEAGWILENYTYDLHNSEYNEGNIMTEYETKFSAMGTPINRLVAYREKK